MFLFVLRYNGACTSREEGVRGSEYIIMVATSKIINVNHVIMELSQYRAKEEFYGNKYVVDSANKVEPIVWWKGT